MRSPVRPTPRRRHGSTTWVVRPGLLRLENRVLPAVFVVNSLVDGVDAHPGDGVALTADGHTTLRAAVMEANALPGPDTVILPAGTYVLSIADVSAAGDPDTAATGDLDLLGTITLQGPGAGVTRIQGQGLD